MGDLGRPTIPTATRLALVRDLRHRLTVLERAMLNDDVAGIELAGNALATTAHDAVSAVHPADRAVFNGAISLPGYGTVTGPTRPTPGYGERTV